MKKSLRKTFTLIFISIVAVLMVLFYAINSFFLEDFYLDKKVDTIKEAYSIIDELILTANKNGETVFNAVEAEYGKNIEDSPVIATLRTLSDGSNIDFVMKDKYSGEKVSTSREAIWLENKLGFYIENIDDFDKGLIPSMPEPVRRPPDEIAQKIDKDKNSLILIKNDDYYIMKIFDSRSQTYYLESFGTFSDERTIFLMSMPVASIIESVQISNNFFFKAGLIVLVLGSIIIFFATSKITKPINSLAEIAVKMSEMDFSAKYDGKENNEIGSLGKSINEMSEKLEKSIGDLKTANAKLLDDISEKQKIENIRKDFISNISHELKTPISLIEGYAEGLIEGLCEDRESRDYYCSVILDEAGRMDRLVKQLTSLENLEYSSDSLEYARFDLADMVRSIVNVMNIKISEKEASVSVNVPEHAFVWADEYMTEEVVTNYISNAVNHVATGGNIDINLDKLSDIYKLSVYNDGECIPEESISHIWEKFYKVDKARTREYGGSGIGLSIVKAIMELHHKEYGVINKENGVLFYADFEAAIIQYLIR